MAPHRVYAASRCAGISVGGGTPTSGGSRLATMIRPVGGHSIDGVSGVAAAVPLLVKMTAAAASSSAAGRSIVCAWEGVLQRAQVSTRISFKINIARW